jgi:hypothetical protein
VTQVTDPGDLLTVGQVAEELRKPPRTIHHWISIGRLSAAKLDPSKQTSAYVVTRAEVERVRAEEAA